MAGLVWLLIGVQAVVMLTLSVKTYRRDKRVSEALLRSIEEQDRMLREELEARKFRRWEDEL